MLGFVLNRLHGTKPPGWEADGHFCWRQATRLLLVSIVCLISLTSATAPPEDKCEYDIDFTNNKMKIVCEGSPAKVSIFADTASIQADDVMSGGGNFKPKPTSNMSKPKGSTGTSSNSSRGDTSSGSSVNQNDNNGEYPHVARPKPDCPTNPSHSEHRHRHGGLWQDTVPHAPPYCKFSDYVWNATRRLDKAKRQLSTYIDSIQNTSTSLAVGDLKLREDMKNLKATKNHATELKDGIIAAMRNQYNFIRSTLLVRNNELQRLVASLNTLVEVTSDGLHSALDAHKRVMEEMIHVNQTLSSVRRMVKDEMKKRSKGKVKSKGKPKDECPKFISAIGTGEGRLMTTTMGAYMVESYNPSDIRPVYVMKGAGSNDQLEAYDMDVDVYYRLVGRYISLPYSCVGTGHAVYKRHFYCHKSDSSTLIKYHLKRMDIVAEMELTGVGFGNQWPYSSEANTDVDLAVDEMGLWALYATNSSKGNLVITKINQRKMEVESTFNTSYPKRNLGNAFMICGVLYAVESHCKVPTYISYVFNTITREERRLEPGVMPFANFAHLTELDNEDNVKVMREGGYPSPKRTEKANMSMLSYDFRTRKIHSWNNGRIEVYPVFFKDNT